MDKSDLQTLLVGASAEEVDQIHRLLHEWGVGPEESFPVQLTLLTRAQLQAAASVPTALLENRKWLTQHLAEYRRQSQSANDAFCRTVEEQSTELKAAAESIQQAAAKIRTRLTDAEASALRVRTLMDNAEHKWEVLKTATENQCDQLGKISESLQDRFAWRQILWAVFWFALTLAFGIFVGHYGWPQ